MDWKVVSVELFAIVASYLVISMSIASATTVTIHGAPPVQTTVNLNIENYIDREVSLDTDSLILSLGVSNVTSDIAIESVWVYKCKDKNPDECMEDSSILPESFAGNVDAGFSWSEVADTGSGFPQTANLYYIVKIIRSGKVSWLSFWSVVERESSSVYSVEENEISNIDITASGGVGVLTIGDFISENLMIPANPVWISEVIFQGASSLFEIRIAGEESLESPNRPGSSQIQGGGVSAVSSNYNFILPRDSSGVNNPVTLFLNPLQICGNNDCEQGETPGSCCLDCPCNPGYYCDISKGCMSESGIGLSLYGSVAPRVVNCYETHTVTVPVEIENAPTGYSLLEKWCKLGGTFDTCDCTKVSGDVYLCDVVVPPVPDCGSGEFRISSNGIRFRAEYLDGDSLETRFIETAFPDVAIGSYVCGNSDCEGGLGESSSNCCHDCGCPSGYCDYYWGAEPSSAACKSDPTALDIYAESVDPAHFYSHVPGDRVLMGIVFGNAPKALSVEYVSCEMGCSYDGTECGASCSIVCSEAVSSDPEKYNLSCVISFTISGYDNLRDYILSPDLTFDVRYRNGTGTYIEKSLNKTFNQVSIGSHWCGDRACGQDEDYGSCCYDCSCPGGQYCDTQSIEGPTEGDFCRDADFELVVDSIGSLELEDSSIEHRVPITAHVENHPTGTSIASECSLADGGVSCGLGCIRVSSGPEDYILNCTLTVPAMDYVTSPYYNGDTREIRLSPNSLNFSLYYNNGPNKAVKLFEKPLGEVVINVIGHCGEGGCEGWLGEDQTNCCRDCGCSDFGENYFCYLGVVNGECLDNSTINLRVVGFEPDPPECIIGKIGGDCKFIKTHVANLHIVNSPPDLEILDAFYQIGDENQTVMDCVKTLEYGNWSCPFTPSPINNSQEGISNRSLTLFMSVGYTLNNSWTTDDLSTTTSFETHRTKSDALIRCEDEIERIQEQINRLYASQTSYDDWSWLYWVLGIIFIIGGIILIYLGYLECSEAGKCNWALILLGITMMMTGATYIVLATQSEDRGSGLDIQIAQLYDMMEQQREICSSEEFEEMAEATQGMGALSPIV